MISDALMLSNPVEKGGSYVHRSSRKPLILVIEDDLDNLVLLYHFLTLNHLNVLLASDALIGLKLAFANSPDLILLDMMLPKMSGYELIRCIRKNLKLATVPVIAVTGMNAEQDKQKILQAGCADYICKPYLLNRLQTAIQGQLAGLMSVTAMEGRSQTIAS